MPFSWVYIIINLFHRKNLVNICVADRTFASIDSIIKGFMCGKLLTYLYKSLWFKESENVENFLQSNAHKILLCDPTDNIVSDPASLKTGIARKVVQKFNQLNYSNSPITSILEIVLNDSERTKLINILISFIALINQMENNKTIKLIDISKSNSSKRNLLLSTSSPTIKDKDVKYTKIKEESGDFELNDDRSNDFTKIIKDLKNNFSKFESAGDNLLSLKYIKSQKLHKELFINVKINIKTFRIFSQICSFGVAFQQKTRIQ